MPEQPTQAVIDALLARDEVSAFVNAVREQADTWSIVRETVFVTEVRVQ